MRIWGKRIEKNDQKIYKFMTIFGPTKPNFLAWTIQGAGNELTISGHNHCHWGAVPAFGLFQTPSLVQQEKSEFLT